MSATTKVVTGKVRFSYANVWEPHAMEGSDRAKYSVSILIPKTDSELCLGSRRPSTRLSKKASPNWVARFLPRGRTLSVTGTPKDRTIRSMLGTCSSMPTRTTVLASWTSTSTPSSKKRISTPDAMAGRRSTSTFSTRMATKALLAG